MHLNRWCASINVHDLKFHGITIEPLSTMCYPGENFPHPRKSLCFGDQHRGSLPLSFPTFPGIFPSLLRTIWLGLLCRPRILLLLRPRFHCLNSNGKGNKARQKERQEQEQDKNTTDTTTRRNTVGKEARHRKDKPRKDEHQDNDQRQRLTKTWFPQFIVQECTMSRIWIVLFLQDLFFVKLS